MRISEKLLPEKIPAIAAIFYNLFPARMFIPHYQLIAQEVSVPDNAKVLDIGTGPGILPIEIAKRFPAAELIGIDLSEKMIAIANKKKKKSGLSNVVFTTMNANALTFDDNFLDMVISTGSMHHWKTPEIVLNEVYRCLKPGCEAWIYDGYGDATDADIEQCIRKLFLEFPSNGLVKKILGIHGYSQYEYDTKVKDMISRTLFKTGTFEKRGIMMCVRLRKQMG
jgi:ubiquinone/menaquinone biosynthesis C-methylase UbiE